MKKDTSFNFKVARKWHLIDAKEDNIGRIATKAGKFLQGKHKATFSPQIDDGDFVIVMNTKYLKVSHPSKWETKIYYRHSNHPGGIKKRTLKETFDIDPNEVIKKAVYGMLAKNKLRSARMRRLKLFPDDKGKKLFEDMTKVKPVKSKVVKDDRKK